MPDLDRITRSPHVMGGKPCLRSMRVTVGTLVGLVASRHPFSEIPLPAAWRSWSICFTVTSELSIMELRTDADYSVCSGLAVPFLFERGQ
jgi:hypothetical protein